MNFQLRNFQKIADPEYVQTVQTVERNRVLLLIEVDHPESTVLTNSDNQFSFIHTRPSHYDRQKKTSYGINIRT